MMEQQEMTDVVPPFAIDLREPEIAMAVAGFQEVLRSGRLILGPKARKFEEDFASVVGVAHGVAVNSGSTALEVIYRHIGVAGKEVLVPTNTNFATAAAVLHAGGTPVFFDGGLYPDVDDIATKITDKTAAVVVVHIGGYVSPQVLALRAMCYERGLVFVEDAAHAHCATLDGMQAGSFGHAAAFSFFVTKVITTGEGGMIVTNDKELADHARSFRDQGKDSTGLYHINMGNSWRLTEAGAVIGLSMLPTLEGDTVIRQEIMNRYETELASCPGLEFPRLPAGMRPSGYKSVALLDDGKQRERFGRLLREHGVTIARPVYEVPLHRQPVFQPWVSGAFPEADDFCDSHICLPLWRNITDNQVERVIGAVRLACDAIFG